MGSRNVTAEQAREWLGIQPHSRIATSVVKRLAATVIALEADLAGLRIEHEAHAALLSITRRDRDEARARIAVLEEEQRRDLADVERFRTMSRGYMDERDALRPGFESVVRLATWMSDNRSRDALGYDGCGMDSDEAIVVMQRLMVERDEAKALLDDAQEELHLTALAIYGKDADAHMLHEAAGEVVAERDRLRAVLACERGESAPEGWTRCGGLLREWERNYGKGVHGRVKADGRWWVGKLGILDPLGTSGAPPVTHAEGPAGLKLDGIESADLAAKDVTRG